MLSNREIVSIFSTRKFIAPLVLVASACLGMGCAHSATASKDACGLVEAAEADSLIRVPFETVDGRIYVQAAVNGQGPFRFAVDTGASGMARADESLVSALGLAIQGQTENSDGVHTATADTTHLDSLQLGKLKRNNLDIITRDYSSRAAPGAAFSGIIAREFFADGLLIIDFPGKTLSFSRTLKLPPTLDGVLGYERAFRVPVSIGELQTEGNLDTGANVTFVFPKSLYDRVAASPLEQAGRGTLANGKIQTGRSTIRGPIRVGHASISNVEVRVSDDFPELLVGAHALQGFVLMIDQRSQRIALCE